MTGYPPQDLVFKSRFVPQNLEVDRTTARARGRRGRCSSASSIATKAAGNHFTTPPPCSSAASRFAKPTRSLLPTYDVFDEDRYFEPAGRRRFHLRRPTKSASPFARTFGRNIICRGRSTTSNRSRGLVEQGAEIDRQPERLAFQPGQDRKCAAKWSAAMARGYGRPIFYCNAVGGNDQLIFDGNSIAVNRAGELIAQLPAFPKRRSNRRDRWRRGRPAAAGPRTDGRVCSPRFSLGVRDYSRKCNFQSAVLGLSGGIDSAVVAAIAADALGAGERGRRFHAQPVLFARQHRRRAGPRAQPRHQMSRRSRSASLCRFQSAVRRNFRRPARRHDRRKHAVAFARHDPDGALEQVRPSAAHHRQQERARRRLLHDLWRHGRRPRRHQRRAQDDGLRARALDQSRARNHSRGHDRKAAERRIEARTRSTRTRFRPTTFSTKFCGSTSRKT